MAEPARTSAADQGPDQPDPDSTSRDCMLRLIAAATEGAAMAIRELAEHPDCLRALRRAGNLIRVQSDLAELARGMAVDLAILERAKELAYARGVADGKAVARARLGVVPG